jgi:hypothetical protein
MCISGDNGSVTEIRITRPAPEDLDTVYVPDSKSFSPGITSRFFTPLSYIPLIWLTSLGLMVESCDTTLLVIFELSSHEASKSHVSDEVRKQNHGIWYHSRLR